MKLTREMLAQRLKEYPAIDANPEYGGTLVDWLWDWFLALALLPEKETP